MDKLLKIIWQALIWFKLCLAGSSPNKAASERLADLLYRFGDWPGGVGGPGDRCPAWKFSRGLFLQRGKGAKHYDKGREAQPYKRELFSKEIKHFPDNQRKDHRAS